MDVREIIKEKGIYFGKECKKNGKKNSYCSKTTV